MEVNQVPVEKRVMRHKIDNCGMIFWVKGDADAKITLFSNIWNEIATVTLGGDNNTTTVYCQAHILPGDPFRNVNRSTPNILSPSEFKSFWMSWANTEFQLGPVGEKSIITSFIDEKLRHVSYVQLSDNVQWKMESRPPPPVSSIQYFEGGEEYWVPFKGKIPEDAYIGGHFGEPLFVVRAQFKGSLTPGYCKLTEMKAVICWGGKAIVIDDFEILCGYNFEWIQTFGSRTPPEAVIGGYSERHNEQLFITRAYYNSHLIVGKAHRIHELAYIPWEGMELELTKGYELLVSRSSRPLCGGDLPTHLERRGYYDYNADEYYEEHNFD